MRGAVLGMVGVAAALCYVDCQGRRISAEIEALHEAVGQVRAQVAREEMMEEQLRELTKVRNYQTLLER